ncbi:hypothetical protein AB0M34_21300 [Nocardia sp. NPDC050193]
MDAFSGYRADRRWRTLMWPPAAPDPMSRLMIDMNDPEGLAGQLGKLDPVEVLDPVRWPARPGSEPSTVSTSRTSTATPAVSTKRAAD